MYDKFDRGSGRPTINRVTTFDSMDHHEYGLIRISVTEYVRCTDKCCKSGGPAFGSDPNE